MTVKETAVGGRGGIRGGDSHVSKQTHPKVTEPMRDVVGETEARPSTRFSVKNLRAENELESILFDPSSTKMKSSLSYRS